MFPKGRMASFAHAIARASFCYRGEHLSLTTVAIFEDRWINTSGCVRLSLSILWFSRETRGLRAFHGWETPSGGTAFIYRLQEGYVHDGVLTITMETSVANKILDKQEVDVVVDRRSLSYDNHFITNRCFRLLEKISLESWGMEYLSYRYFSHRFEGNWNF